MTIKQRISHLAQVGDFLSLFTRKDGDTSVIEHALANKPYHEMLEQISRAVHYNGWFTKDNVLFALEQWGKALTEENLTTWTEPYSFKNSTKTVAIVMAGNIPLVGLHDFISVLISGNNVVIKQSSNDQRLLPLIADFLIAIEPAYKDRITFTEGRLEQFDAVIATGSNNTARYFEYYFASKPSIIRKNRNSVAVISGSESAEDLQSLGNDIFRYFGLGCRNVSKLYVPENYDFEAFYTALSPWNELMNHAKYANNYDYNKAVYLMSEFKFLDNGFLILKEEENFGSPIATLFYETYSSEETLKSTLHENRMQLQCIVSRGITDKEIAFGQSQHPKLTDFADNVDTLSFLEKLN